MKLTRKIGGGEQTIPGKEDASLSSLAWVGPAGTNSSSTPAAGVPDPAPATPPPPSKWRLFSGGLDGQLVEWDVAQRRPLAATSSSGGAVWAMAVEPPSARHPGPRPSRNAGFLPSFLLSPVGGGAAVTKGAGVGVSRSDTAQEGKDGRRKLGKVGKVSGEKEREGRGGRQVVL